MFAFTRGRTLAGLLLALTMQVTPCQGSFILGSTYGVRGFNAPVNFYDDVTLDLQTKLVADGRLRLTERIMSPARNQWWLEIGFETVDGSTMVPDVDSIWLMSIESIQMSRSWPVIATFFGWTVNGSFVEGLGPLDGIEPHAHPFDDRGGQLFYRETNDPSPAWFITEYKMFYPGLVIADAGYELEQLNGFRLGVLIGDPNSIPPPPPPLPPPPPSDPPPPVSDPPPPPSDPPPFEPPLLVHSPEPGTLMAALIGAAGMVLARARARIRPGRSSPPPRD